MVGGGGGGKNDQKENKWVKKKKKKKGGNGKGNQLGVYACMLAPTPGQPQYRSDGRKMSRWSRGTGTWTNSYTDLQ